MSYTHLTLQERFDISHLKNSVSLRKIARRLGRSHRVGRVGVGPR
jgi:IS30 family transposase